MSLAFRFPRHVSFPLLPDSWILDRYRELRAPGGKGRDRRRDGFGGYQWQCLMPPVDFGVISARYFSFSTLFLFTPGVTIHRLDLFWLPCYGIGSSIIACYSFFFLCFPFPLRFAHITLITYTPHLPFSILFISHHDSGCTRRITLPDHVLAREGHISHHTWYMCFSKLAAAVDLWISACVTHNSPDPYAPPYCNP